MNIIAWIVLGAIAGWLASSVLGHNHSLLKNIILGIVGAFVGGFLMNAFGGVGITGFNFYSLLVAALGSAILIFAGRVLSRGDEEVLS